MNGKPYTIDAHIHYSLPWSADRLVKLMDDAGTDAANLVIVPHRQRLSSIPDALMAKAQYPERLFVFAGFDVSVYFRYKNQVGRKMAQHVEAMLRCGCDGVKIIEGKPMMRKQLPVPDWDSPVWEPFWAYAENSQVPILWHVNDPETFWDAENAPSWAAERGWLYDESYINNEAQYTQVLNVLDRHPRLKIIFAHFFFLSAQLDRLSDILGKYPNLMVDITPGIEMYENFSANPAAAASFFRKYGHRIVYGTDIGARFVLSENAEVSAKESLDRAELVQAFLSEQGSREVRADGIFLANGTDFTMHCLGLTGKALEDILSGNFLRFVGQKRTVRGDLVRKECRRIKITLTVMRFFDKKLKADFSCIKQVNQYFKQRSCAK